MLHCKFSHSSPRIFRWDITRSTIIVIHYRDFIFNSNNWRLIQTNLCIRYYIAKHVYLYARNTCYYITKNNFMCHNLLTLVDLDLKHYFVYYSWTDKARDSAWRKHYSNKILKLHWKKTFSSYIVKKWMVSSLCQINLATHKS